MTKDNVIALIEKYAAAKRACPFADDERIVQCRKDVERAIENLLSSLDGKVFVETKPNAPAKGFTEIRRDQVFRAIDNERIYQDLKWGTIQEHPHEVGAWLTVMRKLLNDADYAWCGQRGDVGALDEIRKVAAVAVACMEQHGVVLRQPAAHGPEPIKPYEPYEPEINLEGYREGGCSLAD